MHAPPRTGGRQECQTFSLPFSRHAWGGVQGSCVSQCERGVLEQEAFETSLSGAECAVNSVLSKIRASSRGS